MKDLETKVEELEKASEAANHENSLLRARVEQMTSELNQYKQKLTVMTSSAKPLSREKVPFGSAAVSNLGDVNFQFEFPKFGVLPGPSPTQPQRSSSQSVSPLQQGSNNSPARSQSNDVKDDLARFSGVFSPSMSSSATNPSRASLDSGNSIGAATSSPSASSHSNTGPSSSCGTSPEPFNQSPMGFKPIETMTTIGEEQHPTTSEVQALPQFGNIDFSTNNFDWLAHQNGGQFDPQLFGDYREPQDNILSNNAFDEFFNDAVDSDFFTPYNMASPGLSKNTLPKKKNILDEIDAQQDSVEDEPLKKQAMNCNQLW